MNSLGIVLSAITWSAPIMVDYEEDDDGVLSRLVSGRVKQDYEVLLVINKLILLSLQEVL